MPPAEVPLIMSSTTSQPVSCFIMVYIPVPLTARNNSWATPFSYTASDTPPYNTTPKRTSRARSFKSSAELSVLRIGLTSHFCERLKITLLVIVSTTAFCFRRTVRMIRPNYQTAVLVPQRFLSGLVHTRFLPSRMLLLVNETETKALSYRPATAGCRNCKIGD